MTDDRVPGKSRGTIEDWVCSRCGTPMRDVIKPKRCPEGHAGTMHLAKPPSPER
jgi:rubrerythrin